MTTSLQVRTLQEADLPRCVDLCITAYSNHFFQLLQERHGLRGNAPWQEIERKGIMSTFAGNMDQMFVATLDDEVVGYILYHYTHIQEGRVGIGYLSNNAVDPRLQGRGVGKRLGRKVVETFRQLQLHYARTTTSSQACQAAARNVYQRLGYEICRESVDWTIDLRQHRVKACKPQGLPCPKIRRATPHDLDRILSIGLAYFEGTSLYARWQHHGLGPDLAWQDVQCELVREALRNRLDHTLVTEVDGEVVGYIAYEIDEDIGVGTTNVMRGQGEDMALNNAIDPRYRGSGLESYQLAHVMDIFQDSRMAIGITRGLNEAVLRELGLELDYSAWGFTPLRGYVDLFMCLG